jgi:hypothetical protein
VSAREPSPREAVVAALCGLAFAAYLTWLGAVRHPQLRVPSAIAWVLAGVLACAAATLLARAARRPRLVSWLAVPVLAGFAAAGAWIALGAGPRACRASGPGVAVAAGGMHCRAAFGVGALVAAGMTLLAVRLARATQDTAPRG